MEMTLRRLLVVLGELALDPTHKQPFMEPMSCGSLLVWWSFDRLSLPGSPIMIIKDPADIKGVVDAINKNLNGPMFAAAKDHRELERKRGEELRVVNPAERAYWKDLEERGVLPKELSRDEKLAFYETPTGLYLEENSPVAIYERDYEAKVAALRAKAWPGWFQNGCESYTDYLTRLKAI